MIILKTVDAISAYLEKQKKAKTAIGFVPTMGALHEGHLFLIGESKKKGNLTVCSIFVNPTQFNDKKDFEKYPSKTEEDIALLIKVGCDVLFLPPQEEVYPAGQQKKHYELGNLENLLEGKYRLGHFQGVCQVVDRLLQIVQPEELFMGQKDYQQCMVIQKLIEITNIETKLIICQTVREKSGLAMSSRNMRLTEKEKESATAIYQCLFYIKEHITTATFRKLEEDAITKLLANGFEKIDYIAICNATTLEAIQEWDASVPTVVVAAAFINGVRLIDNLLV